MNKYYLVNHIVKYGIKDLKEGDIIDFEMPSFCSGDYSAKVEKDDLGLYSTDELYFDGCRDFSIRK